jgi:uncharacterized protein (TIGR02246 family)
MLSHTLETSTSKKVRQLFHRAAPALLAFSLVAGAAGPALAGDARDEGAVRALGDGFASAFVHKDAVQRASLFAEDGTFVTPPGDYLQGRAEMVKEFGPEAQHAVNTKTAAAFSNYRIRFISPDVAAVDARLTVRNANGPNATIIPMIPIDFYYVAVRHGDGWLIEDGRTHFASVAAAPSNMGMSRASR